VTLTFSDEIDCSRGDLIVSPADAPEPVRRITATLVWMSDEKLVPHRSYWLKIGTQNVSASVGVVDTIVDVNTLERRTGAPLALNDIGQVEIDLDRAIPGVRYEQNRKLGGFILIDKITHATVAAGLVQDFPANAVKPAARSAVEDSITWVTGAERSAWAADAAKRLKAQGRPVIVIDEAAVASFPGNDPVHSAREVARLVASAGVSALVTIEVSSEDARPGRVIDSSSHDEGGGEWVI
jgi:bifunctional enzyme CysN/CysC